MKKTQKKPTSVTKLKQVKKPEPKKTAKPVKKAEPVKKAAKPAAPKKKAEPKKPQVESAYLLQVLYQVIAALKWEIHIPRTKDGTIVPYAIIGRPLFANLVKDHLEKVHFNEALNRSFIK